MSAPRLPTISDIWRDPVGSASQIAIAPFSLPVATTAEAGRQLADKAPTITGQKSLTDQAADQAANQARAEQEAEEAARSEAVNSALSDKTLDAVTRQELLKLYQTGGSSSAIADVLNKARQGKGIYGVRALNQNILTNQSLMPGRSQVLSLGTGGALT